MNDIIQSCFLGYQERFINFFIQLIQIFEKFPGKAGFVLLVLSKIIIHISNHSFYHFSGEIVPFIEFLIQHASVLTILTISAERHHVICHPLKAAVACTRTKAAVACSVVWVVAAIVTR